jgi:hypothetical protein
MEEHPIEDGALRMTRPVDSCHGGRNDSKNRPERRKSSPRTSPPGRSQIEKDRPSRESKQELTIRKIYRQPSLSIIDLRIINGYIFFTARTTQKPKGKT